MLRLTANQEYSSFYDEGDLPAKRSWLARYTCCCCASPLAAVFCAIFSMVFLAGCAIAVFLVFPRIPAIIFRDLTYQNHKPIAADSLSKNSRISNGRLVIPLVINFDIYSENFYDISILNSSLKGSINGVRVSQSDISDPLIIVGREKTHLPVPFDLFFNMTDNSPENIALLKTVNSSCNPDPAKRKSLSIDLEAGMTLKILTLTEKIPDISKVIELDCPWDLSSVFPEHVKTVLNTYKAGNS